ncbi:hypothetical protein K435DRAFT_853158 [Dendrothele bispora CBS 962.96]|uniref:Uncharacterized protein n=1 Tax=Dendrothele bispora (strain CBS 962.96) TaxID=1314807 RepID=A0A4S8MHN4_DENBC|nr:hypothetical protein K435DRAFT_853158 [Dendrothele bispora CBS 962.96]
MPAQSVHQPFAVHVEDAHPQVRVGRRNRGRSMLMTTMEFRTAASSAMQVRAENASGLRISITGPKPGEDEFEEKPSFEATASCRPVYNTRTAITVTHRDVNLALIKRTNPVRFVTVAPIPENEVPPLPPVPGTEVEATSCITHRDEGNPERPSLDDIPPRPSCPEPTGDDDDDDTFPELFLKRQRPFSNISNNPSRPSPSASLSCPSNESFDAPSEYSLTYSHTESLSSKSGPLTSLTRSLKLKMSERISGSTASLSRSAAASSTVSLTASVKSSKGKNGVRKLFSVLGKGKGKSREGVDLLGENKTQALNEAAYEGKGAKRAREDDENLLPNLEQDSKENREIKGRRIKRKLAAF